MFDLFFYLIVFVFGLIVGSFLNCVIYRLKTGGSFLKGRSFCPYCKHELSWQDLIPIFSFLILKGECRYCGEKISIQYPAVETATGLLFLLIFNPSTKDFLLCSAEHSRSLECFGFQFLTPLYYFIISCFLIIVFVYDLKHFIIPDRVIYLAIIITFLYNIFHSLFIIHNSKFLIQSLSSAFGAALFFLLIVLVSRGRWMGVGDIKLAFLMGLFLGWPNILVALFLAFFIGAVIGIILMVLKKKNLKSEIPFGPFLVTGTFLALFWGEKIIHWYLNFVLL